MLGQKSQIEISTFSESIIPQHHSDTKMLLQIFQDPVTHFLRKSFLRIRGLKLGLVQKSNYARYATKMWIFIHLTFYFVKEQKNEKERLCRCHLFKKKLNFIFPSFFDVFQLH